MGRILLGSLLGAIVIFVWSWVSWTILPWHTATIRDLPNEAAVVDTLKDGKVATGVYFFPLMPKSMDPAAQEAFMQKHRAGPFGLIIYSAEGANPMDTGTFARGFLLNFISALLACVLLWYAAPGLRYTSRLIFITAMGLFTGVVTHLAMWNWMHAPLDYTLALFGDVVVGWFIAGLVIAAIVHPRATRTPAATEKSATAGI